MEQVVQSEYTKANEHIDKLHCTQENDKKSINALVCTGQRGGDFQEKCCLEFHKEKGTLPVLTRGTTRYLEKLNSVLEIYQGEECSLS